MPTRISAHKSCSFNGSWHTPRRIKNYYNQFWILFVIILSIASWSYIAVLNLILKRSRSWFLLNWYLLKLFRATPVRETSISQQRCHWHDWEAGESHQDIDGPGESQSHRVATEPPIIIKFYVLVGFYFLLISKLQKIKTSSEYLDFQI